MNKQSIFKAALLSLGLIIMSISAQSQIIYLVYGTITDNEGLALDGVQINLEVNCDSFIVYSSTIYSNPNGFFVDTIGACLTGDVVLTYTCPDGTTNTAIQWFTPNTPDINFTLVCQGNIDPPDSLCVDPLTINPNTICPGVIDPVCGCDGQTYNNSCEAENWYGITSWTQGACGGGVDTTCFVNATWTPTGTNGLGVSFFNLVTGGTPPYIYDWDFGDGQGSTVENPEHYYSVSGSYVACLTVTDALGYSCEMCIQLWVQEIPDDTLCIDPTLINPNTVCPGVIDPVCGCDGQTYNNACEAENWYGVTSWTQGSCGGGVDTTCFVNATWIPTGINGLGVSYISVVSGGNPPYAYAWDFGDGETSTEQNPSHFYSDSGLYIACVTATDALGNTCSQCLQVWVQEIVIDTLCIDPLQIDTTVSCPEIYDPVCGCDGVTYANSCHAEYYGGIIEYTAGTCGGTDTCSANPVIIEIILDNYPGETTWDIIDESGIIVASGGPYGTFPDGSLVSVPLCVEDGCYLFTIYDSFGDGICCQWGQGYYVILDGNGAQYGSGGDFDFQEQVYININSPDTCAFPIDTTEVCLDWDLINLGAVCPAVYDPVCGCDGVTYSNACIAEECFGVAIWTLGACDGNGSGNNGGGGNPTDSICNISVGFQYFGQPLNNDEWGFAFFSDVSDGLQNPTYFWDLGDGTTAFTEDVAHSYPAPDSIQSYTVCLTVFDVQQCGATVCETIVIDNDPNGNVGGNVSEGSNFAPGASIEKTDGPGDPMPDVHIVLLDPAGNIVQETYTDAFGNYHFFNMQFGDYAIWVDIPGIPHEPYKIKLTPIAQFIVNLNFSVDDDGVTTTGINEVSFADQISVFPNPATSSVMVDISLIENATLAIELTNVLGQKIYFDEKNLQSGSQSFSLNLEGLNAGIYLLSLRSGNEVLTEKIIKE